MRRGLITLTAALSLVLCAVTILVWLCSYFAFAPVGQFWTTSWDGNSGGFLGHGWVAASGSLHLLRVDRLVQPAPTSRGDHHLHSGIDPAPGIPLGRTTFGFGYTNRVSTWRERGSNRRVTDVTQELAFPIWLLAAFTAILPTGGVITLLRRKRLMRHNLCATCGYDLRGNLSGVCPECGRPITTTVPLSHRGW